LDRLSAAGFPSLKEASQAIEVGRGTGDLVTRDHRGMALSLSVLGYLVGADLLGQLASAAASVSTVNQSQLGLLACFVLAVIVGAAARGGFWLRAFGIAVVGCDGREVTRSRAALRAAFAWSWAPVQVAVAMVGGPLLPIQILKVVAVLYAADHPTRGPQDVLNRTYLVPR
jgi:hypothetical protein